MILLDTHVLVWFAEDNPSLGAAATKLADAALAQDELLVCALSFWEIAMLAGKGRLELKPTPAAFRRRTLEHGIGEIAVSGDIGITAAGLTNLHGDPADRIIAATAMSVDATLLTADERLLRWRGKLRTSDARR